jgi:hypothetical protein
MKDVWKSCAALNISNRIRTPTTQSAAAYDREIPLRQGNGKSREYVCPGLPFPSRWSQAALVFGDIDPTTPLRIRSLMPDGGVIFSDGIESDGLEFRSGMEATIDLADKRGRLLQ